MDKGKGKGKGKGLPFPSTGQEEDVITTEPHFEAIPVTRQCTYTNNFKPYIVHFK